MRLIESVVGELGSRGGPVPVVRRSASVRFRGSFHKYVLY